MWTMTRHHSHVVPSDRTVFVATTHGPRHHAFCTQLQLFEPTWPQLQEGPSGGAVLWETCQCSSRCRGHTKYIGVASRHCSITSAPPARERSLEAHTSTTYTVCRCAARLHPTDREIPLLGGGGFRPGGKIGCMSSSCSRNSCQGREQLHHLGNHPLLAWSPRYPGDGAVPGTRGGATGA
eukprot:gene9553-biopygen9266